MSGRTFRVTVIDDHSLLAEALVIALQAQGIDARCISPNGQHRGSLESAAVATGTDMVVLDLDLGGGGDGMAFVPGLRQGGVDVVILTGSTDRARHGEALALGAKAVLSKSEPFSAIVTALRQVAEGLPVMSREEQQALIEGWREAAASQRDLRRRFAQITRREAEVLGLLMAGRHVTEIARIRFVSESTVRTQVKSLLAKLEVSSQLTAVGLAHQLGWRPPGEPEKAALGA
jgi:DNA-binding NarL/FixJ family response regulator